MDKKKKVSIPELKELLLIEVDSFIGLKELELEGKESLPYGKWLEFFKQHIDEE